MVTCRWVVDRLAIYLAGELDTKLADKITAHLVRCGRCSRVAEQLGQTNAQLQDAFQEPITVPSTLDSRVMAAVSRLPQPQPAPTPSRFGLPVKLAFAAGLVLAGFGLGRVQWTARPEIDITAFTQDHRATETATKPIGTQLTNPSFVVYKPESTGAELCGEQGCRIQSQPVVHLSYQWEGQTISLFELDARKIDLPRLRQQVFDGRCLMVGERGGYSFALWCTGTTHCILMARTTPEKLLPLASAMIAKNATAGMKS
jgi:anti-sigma factor RsiW